MPYGRSGHVVDRREKQMGRVRNPVFKEDILRGGRSEDVRRLHGGAGTGRIRELRPREIGGLAREQLGLRDDPHLAVLIAWGSGPPEHVRRDVEVVRIDPHPGEIRIVERYCTVPPSMSASIAHLFQVPSALSVADTAIISHEFGFTVQSRATATKRPECWSNRTRVSNGKSAGSPGGVTRFSPEFIQGNALEEGTGNLVEHPEIADRQGDEVKGPRRPHRVGGDQCPGRAEGSPDPGRFPRVREPGVRWARRPPRTTASSAQGMSQMAQWACPPPDAG